MKLRVDGGEIVCDVRGTGPGLLLLHAFPLGLAMWDPQMEALASRFQVVRFDARGFGGSPPGEGLLTMERIAADAVALLDHFSLSRATVVGLSMGGYAALALARRQPERLRSLVLCDTRAGADSPEARANRAALAERVGKEGPAAAAEAMVPRLLGPTSLRDRPEVARRVRDIILGNPAQGIVNGLGGLAARADSTETLRQITVPTLLVFGDEDVLTPVAEGQALQAGIAGSRLTVVPQAGHLSNLENPAAFNAALTEFLAGLL